MINTLKLLRPKQWIKNLLIFSVPALSGEILNSRVLTNSILLFFSFSLLASAIYVLNDIRDIENDKAHPRKSSRPIASGQISIKNSKFIFFGLASLGTLLSFCSFNFLTFVTLSSYFIIQIIYVIKIKNLAVIELGSVASGFVLRAISGGVVNEIPISFWFLTVISSVSLFIVAGKRFSELKNMENESSTRPVLSEYNLYFLQTVVTASLTASLIFYALWAAEISSIDNPLTAQASTGIFVLLLFKYSQIVETGKAESPEDLITKEPTVIVLIILWASLMFSHLFGIL